MKFKVYSQNNQELWGVNTDFSSHELKWTIDAILQHMGFYPTTENPCIMMRVSHIIKSCEYIIIYHDELYIALTPIEEIFHITQDKYKIKINPEVYQGSNFPYVPGGTLICQRKYMEKLYINDNMLFKDNLPQDLYTAFQIIRLLIEKGNLNLIHSKNSYQHFNHLSRKRKLDKLYNEM